MHAIALHASQFGRHLDLLTSMYRLRCRVFKDRLNWRVSVSGDLEIDIYDVLSPTYILAVSEQDEVLGCVRLCRRRVRQCWPIPSLTCSAIERRPRTSASSRVHDSASTRIEALDPVGMDSIAHLRTFAAMLEASGPEQPNRS